MRSSRCAIAIVMICLGSPASALGQEQTSPSRDWWIGGSLGLPGSGLEFAALELLMLSFHANFADPGRLGLDFKLGTPPRLTFDGTAALTTRIGATLPFGSERVLVWPSAGLSGLAINYEDEAVARVGGYAGLAATVLVGGSRSGMRAGASAHKLSGGNDLLWFVELGFMWRR